jgi:hypothetical protein
VIVYVPDLSVRLFEVAMLYRLLETPTLIGPVVEIPLEVLDRIRTLVHVPVVSLTTAEMLVADAGQAPSESRVKFVWLVPVLGLKYSAPRLGPVGSAEADEAANTAAMLAPKMATADAPAAAVSVFRLTWRIFTGGPFLFWTSRVGGAGGFWGVSRRSRGHCPR